MDQTPTPSVPSRIHLEDKEQNSDLVNPEGIQNPNFKHFYDYDFHSDDSFLNGWRRIPDRDNPDNYVKAKAFYYSREFAPVSVDGYKQWLLDNQLVDKGPPKVSTEELECEGDNVKRVSDNEKHVRAADNDTFTSDKNSSGTESESVSFGQVIDFIEKGLSLPGIKDLNIEPINLDPKPSEIQRKRKPWEQDT